MPQSQCALFFSACLGLPSNVQEVIITNSLWRISGALTLPRKQICWPLPLFHTLTPSTVPPCISMITQPRPLEIRFHIYLQNQTKSPSKTHACLYHQRQVRTLARARWVIVLERECEPHHVGPWMTEQVWTSFWRSVSPLFNKHTSHLIHKYYLKFQKEFKALEMLNMTFETSLISFPASSLCIF